MNEEQMETAERMARDGSTIEQIRRELGLEWGEVSEYLNSVDAPSWLGAKNRITNRLNDLRSENDQAAREKLVDAADKWVDYLYDNAKHMRDRVDLARKALE